MICEKDSAQCLAQTALIKMTGGVTVAIMPASGPLNIGTVQSSPKVSPKFKCYVDYLQYMFIDCLSLKKT